MGSIWADGYVKGQRCALAKKMAKSDTKIVTRTISAPKRKSLNSQSSEPAANVAVQAAIKPNTPPKPLPKQQIN